MLAGSPLSDLAASLVQRLPECAPLVSANGAWSKYAADCLVRHLLDTGWPGALALGLDPSTVELVIDAGIGRLRLTTDAQDWQPAATGAQPQTTPLTAPPALVAARLEACASCDRYQNDRCSIAGCGCSGMAQRGNLLSRCPMGRWPMAALDDELVPPLVALRTM